MTGRFTFHCTKYGKIKYNNGTKKAGGIEKNYSINVVETSQAMIIFFIV